MDTPVPLNTSLLSYALDTRFNVYIRILYVRGVRVWCGCERVRTCVRACMYVYA